MATLIGKKFDVEPVTTPAPATEPEEKKPAKVTKRPKKEEKK